MGLHADPRCAGEPRPRDRAEHREADSSPTGLPRRGARAESAHTLEDVLTGAFGRGWPPAITVEVLTLDGLKRYLVLFVIELKTRYIHIAGIHPVPDGAWMEQMALNLTDPDEGFLRTSHHLIHDRDPLYTGLFEEILRRGGYLQRRSTEAEPHRFVAGLTIALRRRSDSCVTARHSRTDPATRLPSIHGRDPREIGIHRESMALQRARTGELSF